MGKLLQKLSIKIFDFIYKKQELNHKKKMDNLKKVMSAKSSSGKMHLNSAATFTIKENLKEEKKANKEKIEAIIKTFLNDKQGVQKLFDYVKGAKTRVYKIKNAHKILAFVNEDEGFILPSKGFKAFYLNLILNKTIGFKTPEMFVLRSFNVNIYALCYQFYNWYCYKMNLSGFEEDTQAQFKNVFKICNSKKIETLSYEEILNLKSAIKRDIEAIDFVMNLAKSNDMAKKNLAKIKKGERVNI